MKGCFSGFFRKIIPIFFCVSIIFTPFSAYALNTDLIEDEVYWIDRGDAVVYNSSDYFQGFSKYIADNDEGCFYFFTRFMDKRIDISSNENITLGFTVKNDVNNYFFKVNKDGIIKGESQNSINEIEIYYNFDGASCQKQGGGIFVAFKLKNKTDRTLNNSVSCEYFCGLDLNYNMLDNISLDMYVPVTEKATSSKTDAQKTTRQTTLEHSDTKAATDDTDERNGTKFSGSGTKSSADSQSNSTKSYGRNTSSAVTTAQTEINDGTAVNEEYLNEEKVSNESSSKPVLSKQAKLLIIIFSVLFLIGISCVIIGIVSGKEKITEADETESEELSVDDNK